MSGNLRLTPNQMVAFLVATIVIIGLCALALHLMPHCWGGCSTQYI